MTTAAEASEALQARIRSEFEHELTDITARMGSGISEIEPISPLRCWDQPRAALRLRFEDGRQAKLRRLRTDDRAAEIAGFVTRFGPRGFPSVLLRRGRMLLTEWVNGPCLTELPVSRLRIEEAARLLGRLHAVSEHDGRSLGFETTTVEVRSDLDRELKLLIEANAVEPATLRAMTRRIEATDPGRTTIGIAHGDLCAENLIVGSDDRLWSIDNEGIHLGSLDHDLARCWARWPMAASDWTAFVRSYREFRDVDINGDSDRFVFWKIRALVRSAFVRIRRKMIHSDEPIEKLRTLVGGFDPS